jgi:XTP/dITP diphosphohydrolase
MVNMRIIAATTNQGKVKEIQAILKDLNIDIVAQEDAGLDIEIEETGTTFEQNALIKARAVSMMCDEPVLADDSGLCVEALGGEPGVYSARYAGEDASDEERMKKVLRELGGTKNRKAKFVTVMAIVFPDGTELTAQGEAEGEITYEPRGQGGFGYDPIFYSGEIQKTFAQATEEEKNRVSHRKRALETLYEKLEQNMQ